MRSADFNLYKASYRAAIRQVLAEHEPGRLDEIGLPAYSHSNPLIQWLFWKRIHTVMDHLESIAPFEHALDFGCGSGVMLPFLSTISHEVTAADIDLAPLEHMRKYIALNANVQTADASLAAMTKMPGASFDLIVALDVLEHVADLAATVSALLRLLRPACPLVVSGPTENLMYQIGRRLAGPEYSGEYHERGVGEIRRLLQRHARVRTIATLYWPLPLFEIFSAQI
jgi:2-polyprenyl-3-methyl-5-hydroxy-6-metoxy-1,4-benzoquinol methylase